MNEAESRAGLAPTAHYRYADRVGDRLYVAGQVPLDRDGHLVGRGDPARQALRCLDNLRILLGVHGFEVAEIRQLTVYATGKRRNALDAWDAVTEWFDHDVPPATLLGVQLLGHRGQIVEIDATVERAA